MPADTQMALPFRNRPQYRPGDFLPAGSNAAARRWLDHPDDWPSGRLVLWGQAGCGKTHLAQGWAGDDGLRLEGRALPALADLAAHGRIVVDDADAGADEPALLHLLNACAEAGWRLLLTGRSAPSRWPVALADLASRLRASQAIGIEPPEDALLQALLARQLAERQLAVSATVQDWLLRRLLRTAGAVQEAVARLDGASLARHQPVTRALARDILPDLLGPERHGTIGGDDSSMIVDR